jgi:hypothetical protein
MDSYGYCGRCRSPSGKSLFPSFRSHVCERLLALLPTLESAEPFCVTPSTRTPRDRMVGRVRSDPLGRWRSRKPVTEG